MQESQIPKGDINRANRTKNSKCLMYIVGLVLHHTSEKCFQNFVMSLEISVDPGLRTTGLHD